MVIAIWPKTWNDPNTCILDDTGCVICRSSSSFPVYDINSFSPFQMLFSLPSRLSRTQDFNLPLKVVSCDAIEFRESNWLQSIPESHRQWLVVATARLTTPGPISLTFDLCWFLTKPSHPWAWKQSNRPLRYNRLESLCWDVSQAISIADIAPSSSTSGAGSLLMEKVDASAGRYLLLR